MASSWQDNPAAGSQTEAPEPLHFGISAPGKLNPRYKTVKLSRTRRAPGPPALVSRVLGLSLGLCRALASSPFRGLALGLRVLKTASCYGAAACTCALFPWTSKLLGLMAIVSSGGRALGVALPPRPAAWQRRLQPLSGPFVTFACMWAVLPLATPGLWRSLMYWQRCLPLASSFIGTNFKAKRARRRGDVATSQALWQAQHDQAADRMFLILCELKGFYLKLGQILATKTEMLPPAYTSSLVRLLDKLPATPFSQVRKDVEKELGGQLSCFFSYFDPFPLASATVAQVHRARLVSGEDVVIKLQHRGAKRMMSSDLANLRLCCSTLDALHVNLGFDLGSVIREYCAQVPLEFDFAREAAMAESIRGTILDYAQHFPLLRQVIIPAMLRSRSTPRLLTMQHIEGVPFLDIATMDRGIKEQLLSAVVLAFGVMILRTGLFHSDPHPGNLLACTAPSLPGEPDVKVAILDFGQVKQLSDESRLRYAVLVCALASREDHLVVATMREMGLVVENCSHEFEAIAGYILFDTRMDFPEAHESPLDATANEGWRSAKVPHLPQDLFMIVRVITLLRGLMHTLGVDISSALMWRPLALQTLAELSEPRGGHMARGVPAQAQAQAQPPSAVSPSGSWDEPSRGFRGSPFPQSAAELAGFIASSQQQD